MSIFFYAVQEAIDNGEEPQTIIDYLIDQGKQNPALMLETLAKDLVTIMNQNHLIPKRKI